MKKREEKERGEIDDDRVKDRAELGAKTRHKAKGGGLLISSACGGSSSLPPSSRFCCTGRRRESCPCSRSCPCFRRASGQRTRTCGKRVCVGGEKAKQCDQTSVKDKSFGVWIRSWPTWSFPPAQLVTILNPYLSFHLCSWMPGRVESKQIALVSNAIQEPSVVFCWWNRNTQQFYGYFKSVFEINTGTGYNLKTIFWISH